MRYTTQDYLRYATKQQIQDLINRMYEAGGGTYEGAAYAYDAGPEAFNAIVNRRNYLQRHPEAEPRIELPPSSKKVKQPSSYESAEAVSTKVYIPTETRKKIREVPSSSPVVISKKSKELPGKQVKAKKSVFKTVSKITGEDLFGSTPSSYESAEAVSTKVYIPTSSKKVKQPKTSKTPRTQSTWTDPFRSFIDRLYSPIYYLLDKYMENNLQRKLQNIENTYTVNNADLLNRITANRIPSYTGNQVAPAVSTKVYTPAPPVSMNTGEPYFFVDKNTGEYYYFDGRKANRIPRAI